MRRCSGGHKVLLVEDFTELGASVCCLLCSFEFHADEPLLEAEYTGFSYVSPNGPEDDKTVYILNGYLE